MDGLSNAAVNLLKSLGYTQKEEVEKAILEGVFAVDKVNKLGMKKFIEICNWLSLDPIAISGKHSLSIRAYEEFQKKGSLDDSLSVILSPRANSRNKMQIIQFLASFSRHEILRVHRSAIKLSEKSLTADQ